MLLLLRQCITDPLIALVQTQVRCVEGRCVAVQRTVQTVPVYTATAKERTCLQAYCNCNWAPRNRLVTWFVHVYFCLPDFPALLASLCRCRRVYVVCTVCQCTHLPYYFSPLPIAAKNSRWSSDLGVTTKLENARAQQTKVQGMGCHKLCSLFVGFRLFLSTDFIRAVSAFALILCCLEFVWIPSAWYWTCCAALLCIYVVACVYYFRWNTL